MNNSDEPILKSGETAEGPSVVPDLSVQDRSQRLVDEQPYAVLCVQGGGQPYGALVAFAFSADLRHAVFATPLATCKYRLLSECNRVALVIDNRRDKADELMEIKAVTATGRAHLIEQGTEYDRWAELLVTRHAYLKSFATADTCTLFRVDLLRFLHIVRLQEVCQWTPTDHS